jgi:hypothetical protein
MGTGVSLILIAAGAILTWAVNATVVPRLAVLPVVVS